MTLRREHLVTALVLAALLFCGWWLHRHLEWVEIDVRNPPSDAARRDRFDALKRLARHLGAQVSAPGNLDQLPPPGATLLLGSPDWDIFPERAAALQRWVEAGGHLWLPYTGDQPTGLGWIPIGWKRVPAPAKPVAASAPSASASPASSASSSANKTAGDEDDDDDDKPRGRPTAPGPQGARFSRAPLSCSSVVEEPAGIAPAFGTRRSYAANFCATSTLQPHVRPEWALVAPEGMVVARVAIGRGSVTLSSIHMPWFNDNLLDSENGLLAAAVLRLHPGQQLWIVADEKREPLLIFLWTHGLPALVLAALALGFALWRGAARFGPRVLPASLARRSMAEQIRGTAEFVSHHGGVALHAASLRAFDEAARSRVQGYDAMIGGERAQAVATLLALDTHALARAMNPPRYSPSALAQLEAARRRLLERPTPPFPDLSPIDPR
jgi:hypothetical protein